MKTQVVVYDPTANDALSAVRGVGRYLQILKENFPNWIFTNNPVIKQLNNDAVFINPFFNFLQKPVVLKRVAKKQVAVIHDLIPLKYPSHFPVGIKGTIYILLNRLALKNYDLIITDSEASKKDIINILKVNKDKIRIIYPCLPKVFTEKSEIRSTKIETSLNLDIGTSNFLLYVGDGTWNKNLVNLARAIKLANVSCVFVGNVFNNYELKNKILAHPWQKELNGFFQLIHGDSRFILKGFIHDSKLINLYEHAKANILPSRDEGFGFSFLEAGANGCPSLLSDIPVLKEISGGNGLFFNPENPEEIASLIKNIFSDKDLREKLITDSKNRSLYFSSKKFKESFNSIIS